MPPVLWGLFIFLLTSIPNPPQPAAPPWWWNDKAAHVALYAVLGALIVRGLTSIVSPWSRVALAVLLAAATGAVDEWHQRLIPGRAADVQDWYADLSGSIAGSLFAFAGFRREFRS